MRHNLRALTLRGDGGPGPPPVFPDAHTGNSLAGHLNRRTDNSASLRVLAVTATHLHLDPLTLWVSDAHRNARFLNRDTTQQAGAKLAASGVMLRHASAPGPCGPRNGLDAKPCPRSG